MVRWGFAVVLVCLGAFASAQTIPPPVLVIDIDTLYQTSEFAKNLRQEFSAQQQALSSENRRLEDSLRAEELRLTELRKTLPAADFAVAAQEFDAKVEEARRTQDEKLQDVRNQLAQQRQVFENRIRPIVGQIMVDRGATLVLEDSAAIFMKFNVLDITEVARDRIDAELATPNP